VTDDIERGPRLLFYERDALLPLLRARAESAPADFDRPTVLPGWSVRDVLAHCSAALGMAASDTMHGFSPEENDTDVIRRRDWPIGELLDELAGGYQGGAAAIGAAGGQLDGLALGEWLHGGDVRDALEMPDAYTSAGVDDALAIIVERGQSERSTLPRTHVTLTDRVDQSSGVLDLGTFELGKPSGGAEAHLTTDTATFLRLIGGRSPDPSRFTLAGAEPSRYVIFN
jgi:uncharacterized protein (TIGR03083 family)